LRVDDVQEAGGGVPEGEGAAVLVRVDADDLGGGGEAEFAVADAHALPEPERLRLSADAHGELLEPRRVTDIRQPRLRLGEEVGGVDGVREVLNDLAGTVLGDGWLVAHGDLHAVDAGARTTGDE